MLLEQLVCNAPAPELVGFSLIFRPRRFLAAQLDRRVAFEIDRLFQQLFDFRNPFVNALRVQSVDLVCRLPREKKNNGALGPGMVYDDLVTVSLDAELL